MFVCTALWPKQRQNRRGAALLHCDTFHSFRDTTRALHHLVKQSAAFSEAIDVLRRCKSIRMHHCFITVLSAGGAHTTWSTQTAK